MTKKPLSAIFKMDVGDGPDLEKLSKALGDSRRRQERNEERKKDERNKALSTAEKMVDREIGSAKTYIQKEMLEILETAEPHLAILYVDMPSFADFSGMLTERAKHAMRRRFQHELELAFDGVLKFAVVINQGSVHFGKLKVYAK